MQKEICVCILLAVMSLFSLCPVSMAQTQISTEYPANQNKDFFHANDFYQSLDSEVYREPNDVSYRVRKKIMYKDATAEIKNFYKNIGRERNNVDSYKPSIHPERQVYFFACAYKEGKQHFTKYVVLDAETKKPLNSGSDMVIPKFEIFPF